MILVADQKRMIADLFARRLEAEGWPTVVATDSPGALKRLAEGDIKLAIIDPGLSGSGIDLLVRLRKTRATAKIPVILFGASDGPAEREAARQAGADAFLVKGRVSPNQMLARVTELLGAPDPVEPEADSDYAIAVQPEVGDARRLARSHGLRHDLHCNHCGRPVLLRLSLAHSLTTWTLGCSVCAAPDRWAQSSGSPAPITGSLP